jgi:hypothetical protein
MRHPENVNHAANGAQSQFPIECGPFERKRRSGADLQAARSGEVQGLSPTESVGQLPNGPRVITQVPGTIRISRVLERPARADHPVKPAEQDAPRSRMR